MANSERARGGQFGHVDEQHGPRAPSRHHSLAAGAAAGGSTENTTANPELYAWGSVYLAKRSRPVSDHEIEHELATKMRKMDPSNYSHDEPPHPSTSSAAPPSASSGSIGGPPAPADAPVGGYAYGPASISHARSYAIGPYGAGSSNSDAGARGRHAHPLESGHDLASVSVPFPGKDAAADGAFMHGGTSLTAASSSSGVPRGSDMISVDAAEDEQVGSEQIGMRIPRPLAAPMAPTAPYHEYAIIPYQTREEIARTQQRPVDIPRGVSFEPSISHVHLRGSNEVFGLPAVFQPHAAANGIQLGNGGAGGEAPPGLAIILYNDQQGQHFRGGANGGAGQQMQNTDAPTSLLSNSSTRPAAAGCSNGQQLAGQDDDADMVVDS